MKQALFWLGIAALSFYCIDFKGIAEMSFSQIVLGILFCGFVLWRMDPYLWTGLFNLKNKYNSEYQRQLQEEKDKEEIDNISWFDDK